VGGVGAAAPGWQASSKLCAMLTDRLRRGRDTWHICSRLRCCLFLLFSSFLPPRSFITTDVNPYYDSFVRWQFEVLHKQVRRFCRRLALTRRLSFPEGKPEGKLYATAVPAAACLANQQSASTIC
jgi:hypothetical protein